MKRRFPNHLASTRLRLRRLHRDDGEALRAYRSLPEVSRYQSWESFGPDDAARLIASQLTAKPNIPGTWFQLAIIEAATGEFIGDCGLHCPKDNPRQMEIGITFDPRYQGQGYATETVECLLDYLFVTLDKHRVLANTDALNHKAASLFRRAGFRLEAHLIESQWFKGQWGSEYLFAVLKREWEERRPRKGAAPDPR